MKKRFLLITTLFSTLLLCSCRVNWFGQSYDVPWYVIAPILAVICVVSYFILMNFTFVCPDCQNEFKPKPYELSVTLHHMGKRLVKCPKCGRRGFCKRKK